MFEDLIRRIENESPVEMPIVIELATSQYIVFSGNTRMDIAYIAGKIPRVILVNVQAILQNMYPS
jgi:hypothetical protein